MGGHFQIRSRYGTMQSKSRWGRNKDHPPEIIGSLNPLRGMDNWDRGWGPYNGAYGPKGRPQSLGWVYPPGP